MLLHKSTYNFLRSGYRINTKILYASDATAPIPTENDAPIQSDSKPVCKQPMRIIVMKTSTKIKYVLIDKTIKCSIILLWML